MKSIKKLREIEFKGYSKDHKKWVYGDAIFICDEIFIAKKDSLDCIGGGAFNTDEGLGFREEDSDIFEIYPESLGQYIGLKDKDGNKIYEGDVVEVCYECDNIEEEGHLYEITIDETYTGKFITYSVGLRPIDYQDATYSINVEELDNLRIVGNIFKENPKDEK